MRRLVKNLGTLLLGLSVATFTGFNSVQVQAAENDDVEIITEELAGYEGFEETEISEDEFQRIMEENGAEALEAEANGAEYLDQQTRLSVQQMPRVVYMTSSELQK